MMCWLESFLELLNGVHNRCVVKDDTRNKSLFNDTEKGLKYISIWKNNMTKVELMV